MKKDLVPNILVMGIVIVNLIFIGVTKEINILGLVSSISGVIAVVLTAKGDIRSYYAYIITDITYVIIAYKSHFYGSVLLQGLYFLPMNFWGIYNWRQNLKKDSTIINTRKMESRKFILLIVGCIITSLLYSIVLSYINCNLPLVDATITCFSIVAMYLLIHRYQEQWYLWIVTNGINVYMWIIAVTNGTENSVLMLATWSIYFINAIYGYINWSKLMNKK